MIVNELKHGVIHITSIPTEECPFRIEADASIENGKVTEITNGQVYDSESMDGVDEPVLTLLAEFNSYKSALALNLYGEQNTTAYFALIEVLSNFNDKVRNTQYTVSIV